MKLETMAARQSGVLPSQVGITRPIIVVLVVIYLILLRVSYTAIIVPAFAYLGYTFERPPVALEAVFLCVAALPSMFLPLEVKRPSQFAIWFFYAVALIPSDIMPLYLGSRPAVDLLILSGVMNAAFLGLTAASYLPRGRLPHIRLPEIPFWGLLIGVSLSAVVFLRIALGSGRGLPGLGEIYARRSEFKQAAGATGGLLAYVSLWVANVIAPLQMGVGIQRRWWSLALLGFLTELMIFGATGLKSVLLTPILLLGIIWTMVNDGRRFALRFMVGLVALLGTGVLAETVWRVNPITAVIVRRLIVTPGVLTGVYAHYYSANPKALLGYSIFQKLVDDPFIQPPAAAIGNFLVPGMNVVANTNFMADGFANFGLAGIVVMSVLLAGVFWLFDSLSTRRATVVGVFLLAAPAYELTNTSLQTGLLTHGLALAVMLAAIVPPHGGSGEGRNATS